MLRLSWKNAPICRCLIARARFKGKDMVNSGSASIAALSSRFLMGLDHSSALAILAEAQIQKISAKNTISTEGCGATRLFLVQTGQARFCHLNKRGELVLFARLVPGDVIGLVATLENPPPYMATAEAISDCKVLAWGTPSSASSFPCILCSEKTHCASLLATCETTWPAMLDWLPRLRRKGWQRP